MTARSKISLHEFRKNVRQKKARFPGPFDYLIY